MNLGPLLVRTVRHFFPELNDWLRALPDTRVQEACIYERHFLAWWGLALYLFQLGSRRQLDYELDAQGTQVLANLNRLADTRHKTRPVHDTLDHFLEHSTPEGFITVRTHMVRRLVRMKVLDSARLLGHLVVLLDGTGLLCWHRRHCDECLTQRHQNTTLYMHKVLEAKVLGPAGIVLSAASEFIENRDLTGTSRKGAEAVKQDCELKAFDRLAPQLKQVFPQAKLVLSGDSLFACGRVLQIAKDNGWSYVLTFKEGHMSAVWADFQQMLPLCPENRLEYLKEDGTRLVYRWVTNLSYRDDEGRTWTFGALQCEETYPTAETTRFAWISDLALLHATVEEIATKGGRYRWKIENEGFNRQKNSGLNLEHVYSTDPQKWKAYYYLLQIAFILIQLLERGSLLRRAAQEVGRTVAQWIGSLKNIARRLLESLRYFCWSADCFDADAAAQIHISFDSS